jgi:chemotaxis protein MotB
MNRLTIVCVAVGGLAVALAGCVSQQKYTESQQKNSDLEQEYQQLNQQMSAEVGAKNVQITRLQGADPSLDQ